MGLPGYLYISRSFDSLRSMPEDTYLCKIGRSYDPRERQKQWRIGLPFKMHEWHRIKVADAEHAERRLHEKLADCRLECEWFALTDNQLQWLKEQRFYPSSEAVLIAFAEHEDELWERKKRRYQKRGARRYRRNQQH